MKDLKENPACTNNLQPIKSICLVGSSYYVDGIYYGQITEKGEGVFKVRCDNGNKYMDGQIITINFSITNKD